MQYKPNRKLKPLVIICFSLLVITLLFWILDSASWGPRLLNQAGVLIFMTALIFLLVRYAFTDYIYQLPDEENRLTVKTVRGKLPRTAAEVILRRGDRIVPYAKDIRKAEDLARMENFCVSLFPDESWVYITQLDGKNIALRLECCEDVALRIRTRIQALSEEE